MARNCSIDILKAIAIILVVCIHADPFENVHTESINGEKINFILDTIGRFAVPFFFATSGYFIGMKTKKKNNPIQYVKKYILKISKIYMAWLLIIVLYDMSVLAVQSKGITSDFFSQLTSYFAPASIYNIYYGTSFGNTYHLWFLVAMVWSLFFLSIFIRIKKVRILLFFSFSLNLFGVTGQSYSALLNVDYLTRDALFFALFYLTLGYWFSLKNTAQLKIRAGSIYGLLIVFLSLEFIERYILVYRLEAPWGDYSLFSIPIIALLLVLVEKNNFHFQPYLVKLGQNTLGVYVIHPILISFTTLLIDRLEWQSIRESFLWNLVYVPFLVTASSFIYILIQRYKLKINKPKETKEKERVTLKV
ncbi:acyltransferase [Sediminibacillus halophilus]|uniref:Surface polysaccharide O-acyltransferase, integral membrane enzyme n=1 Tax=Sediminibacillus halophilus TaxID=482461 RepID=A0A1G9U4T8_9BACI|nr:acyltransferase [Sediminibacillus halophilus]SDM54977.1 Surface polysaccharide O-acyltransferase, integral membrane enzyme [Sediminibacillus halophilus]